MGFFDKWGGAILALFAFAGVWAFASTIDIEREMQRCKVEWLKTEASEFLLQRAAPEGVGSLEYRKQEFEISCMEAAGLRRERGVGKELTEECWKGDFFYGLRKPQCYRQPRWWDQYF